MSEPLFFARRVGFSAPPGAIHLSIHLGGNDFGTHSWGLVSVLRDNGFLMTLETLRERRAEVLEVARRRGAKAVWVFGSVARSEATPASDIDFLVEFEPGRSLLDQVHLIDELGSLLGTPVEVVAKGGLLERDHHILAEAVPL